MLFFRKPNDLIAVFTSLTLILGGLASSDLYSLLLASSSRLIAVSSTLLLFIAMLCLYALLFIFPDGRFAPRWTRWAFIALGIAFSVSTLLGSPITGMGAAPELPLMLTIVWMIIGLYAQWCRYQKAYSPTQRQQTKWVILGAAIAISGQVFEAVIRLLVPAIAQPGVPHLVFNAFLQIPIFNGLFLMVVPLAIGIALFRYHLWEVDLYLNRGVLMGGLTLLLGLLFFAGIAVFQSIVGKQSPLAIAASTLMVGLAFQPVRRNVEQFVDRRVYGLCVDFRHAPVQPTLPLPAQPETKQLGPYHISQLLGRGGMGEVYKGVHPTLHREVAIKVLPATLSTDSAARARFELEARTVAALRHPNIVQVFDFGESDSAYYMVMEYISGDGLDRFMRQNAPLPVDTARLITRDIAAALDYAHQSGLVHRDIKPSNVMLQPTTASSSNGIGVRAILMDFGIAKIVNSASGLTQSGVVVGTFSYMAPEQIMSAREIDHRADIYALGVTLYQMLTAKLPFESDNPGTVIFAHLNRPAPDPREARPDVPQEVASAVLRAMAKNPEDRYPSAGAFASALGGN